MHSSCTKYEKLNKKKNYCTKFPSYFLISPQARVYNAKLHCWSSIEDERRRHLDTFPWTIHPYSSFRWCWMSFMLVTLIFSLIGRGLTPPYDWITTAVITFTFAIDIVFHFRTGYPLDMQHSSKVAELNPKLIAKHYVKSWFIIDLVSAFPFELICLFAGEDNENSVLSGFTSSLRLLKLFRLARILHYANNILKQDYVYKNDFIFAPNCWKQNQIKINQSCQNCFPPSHHIALRRFEFDDDIITIDEEDDEDNCDGNVEMIDSGSGNINSDEGIDVA